LTYLGIDLFDVADFEVVHEAPGRCLDNLFPTP
jgi:hypothetical protein